MSGLRDHVLGQMELADASDDPAQRQARCTFVVVGAGTTGTGVAAQGQLFTRCRAAPLPADLGYVPPPADHRPHQGQQHDQHPAAAR
jgi:hypothetical protein